MNQKLSFGEPFIESRYLEAEESFDVTNSAILVNLDKEQERKRTDKSFMVPKSEIVENGYDLSINKYKEVEYIPVEYPPTSEIMANIREIEKQINKEMDELEKLLNIQ